MIGFLTPSDGEVRELALRETDPQQVDSFEPVVRGPVVAVLLLGLVGLLAAPLHLVRMIRRLVIPSSS